MEATQKYFNHSRKLKVEFTTMAPIRSRSQFTLTAMALRWGSLTLLLIGSIVFPGLAQTKAPKHLSNQSLHQAQELLLSHFPTVYTNGLGFDADEWEQSIRMDEIEKIIEYRRRPFIANNTKTEWFATFIIPLSAITNITEEHKGHTFTIHTEEGQIKSYHLDLLVAKSSTLVINMRDLDTVRNLAERVFSRIQNFTKEQERKP